MTPAPLAHVRYGMPASSIQYFYLTVAQEQGFYREQGLDAELQLAAANAILAALTAGELDYTAGLPGGVRLALRGGPVKVASVVTLQSFTLLTRPDITAPTQLRGKPVAISSPGAISEQAMRRALAHLGLDPQNDVTAIAMGDPAVQWQALQAGAVEAAALTLPYSVLAERDGYRVWVRTDTLLRAANTGLVAPQERIDHRRDEVVRVLRAEQAAVAWMRAHRDEGAALLAAHVDMAPDVARAVYDAGLETYVDPTDLDALRDAVEAVIANESAAGGVEAKGWNDLVDPTLAREAAR
ncbi:MAG TPA: ABC transporter substrate-binding protein [Chloroflexota bacterium]|nr:ABC transporter substrate-binding protein [Chloroflexota bacterium]